MVQLQQTKRYLHTHYDNISHGPASMAEPGSSIYSPASAASGTPTISDLNPFPALDQLSVHSPVDLYLYSRGWEPLGSSVLTFRFIKPSPCVLLCCLLKLSAYCSSQQSFFVPTATVCFLLSKIKSLITIVAVSSRSLLRIH